MLRNQIIFPSLLLTLSIILSIIGFFGKYGFWLDIASYFRVQYLTIQLLCIILCIPGKRWGLLSVIAVIALINILCIAPIYIQRDNLDNIEKESATSILLFNVFTSNRNYQKTIDYINQMDPDILALEEINGDWENKLRDTLRKYPYQKFVTREDNFGIGLYSKMKPQQLEIKNYSAVPSVLGVFEHNDKELTVLLTHPVPPVNNEYFEERNKQFETIASQRANFSHNFILLGDLNVTAWSYYYKELIQKMDLIDSRKGFGLRPTWPTWMPFMYTTIDHVLISENIKIIRHEIGPHIGSDHKPVYVEFVLNGNNDNE